MLATLQSGVQEEEEEDGTLLTPPPTPPSKYQRRQLQGDMSPRHVPLPMTPLPSHSLLPPPSFDAKIAAEQLKKHEGYVSFASVEGLGPPPEEVTPRNEEASRGRRWFLF
jgi:hypothetical protein